jgi:hypothetical protein
MSTTPVIRGNTARLNLTASAVLKPDQGRAFRVFVNTAGAGNAIHDCAAVGDAAVGNRVFAIPNVAGVYDIECPCQVGVTFIFGAGDCAVVYS